MLCHMPIKQEYSLYLHPSRSLLPKHVSDGGMWGCVLRQTHLVTGNFPLFITFCAELQTDPHSSGSSLGQVLSVVCGGW